MVAKRRYAANTTVAVENSQVELVRLLKRHGATQHAFVNDSASGRAAVIFAMGGRQMRLELTVPGEDEFLTKEHPKPRGWYSFSQTRRQDWARAQHQQAERQRWRALILVTKGKLELVAEGLSTIEREFLADILLPDGRRVGDALAPGLAEAYETGNMPPLLPGIGGTG